MEKYGNDKIHHKEKPHKIESKKHREALKKKLLEKQKILKEAQDRQMRLKIETQIEMLTKIMDNFNENVKDNLMIRNGANIFVKGTDALTLNSVKKGLDESMENSMQTYIALSSKTTEFLKTAKLNDKERQKVENILSKFSEHIARSYSNENDLKTESFVKITKELANNLEFISEGRNNTYAHIKKVNKDFMPNFDYLYISSKKYGVPAELLVAIIQNDTSLGKHMASENNFGNVGNDDAGNRRDFDTPQEGIDAVAANIKKRIDKFEEHVKDRSPTVIEIITGKIKGGKRFFGRYMTHPKGPMRVAAVYNKLAETKYVDTDKIS